MILDLFAGPGGWSEGLRLLGLEDVGLEWDLAACETRRSAGHLTIRADVGEYPAGHFPPVEGLIASPPCQAFSAAGKRAGEEHIPALLAAVDRRDWTFRPDPDPRIWLVVDLGRWIEALAPEWVAFEQVPAVLPLWKAYARVLEALGFSTWAGILNAADYGVPQTRRRAILVAHRSRVASAPPRTHEKRPIPSFFGESLRWVTMAEALGWGFDEKPAPTVTGGGTGSGGSPEPFAGQSTREALKLLVNTGRDWKPGGSREDAQEIDASSEPAPTIDGKGRWHVRAKLPAWAYERPATTVVGSFRPDVIAAPGYRTKVSRQNAAGSVSVTLDELSVLQSFPPCYPWQGSKSKKFEQVGNAVPPRLAAHVIAHLTERPIR